jgi:hypothetical protein
VVLNISPDSSAIVIDRGNMKRFLKGVSAVLCGIVMATLLSVSCNRKEGQDSTDSAMAVIRLEAIRMEMRFPADDLLEDRATATRGHEIGAKFIAAQYEQLGPEPAGDNGTYF